MLKKILLYGLTAGALLGGTTKEANAQFNRKQDAYLLGNIGLNKGKYERSFVNNDVFQLETGFKLHTPSKNNNTLFLGAKGALSVATSKENKTNGMDKIEARVGFQHEGENFKTTISADYYPYHFNGESNTLEGYADASIGKEFKTKLTTYYNILEKGLGTELEASYEFEATQDIPIKIAAGAIMNSNYYQTGTNLKGIYGKVTAFVSDFKMLSIEAFGYYNLNGENEKPYFENPERFELVSNNHLGVKITYHMDSRPGDKKQIACKDLIKTQYRRK